MKTVEQEIAERIQNGFVTETLEPIKCVCGCTDFYDVTIDTIENVVCEHDRLCASCHKIVGTWSYGSWMP